MKIGPSKPSQAQLNQNQAQQPVKQIEVTYVSARRKQTHTLIISSITTYLMSSVVDNSGGDQPHDDHPSPGDNNGGSGGGGDKDRNDNNNGDRKNNDWWPVTSSAATGGGESVAAATTTSTSSDGRGGGGGGHNNNNPPSSEECAEALQYREDLEQATRNSIQENVGAYSVVPGSVPSRRESGENRNIIGSTTGGSTAQGGTNNISMSGVNINLPPNIDIIAEATLVVQDEDDEDYDVEAQENDDYDEGEGDDEEDDADTLGLSPNMTPALGGAMDNDGVSVVSAMTNPTVLESGTVASSPPPIREDIVVPRRRSIDSSSMPLVSSTPDSECDALPDASVSIIRAHCENSVNHGSTAAAAPDNLGTVYEAEIIEDGPLHVLRSKSGKVMCSVSIAIILILSIGLAFGLRMNTSTTTDSSSSSPIINDEDLDEVLNYSGGNFCNSVAPQLFFDQYPSYCTKEEVMLGGTIQQAVAIAQRRPHPYCVEVKEGGKTSESIYGWHVCSITNVSPQISLLNGGAVRGEIPDNTPITREMVRNILPFTADKITFIQLKGSDVVKVLENALAFVTADSPLNPYLQAGYPYASGLKFDVDLTADTKVSNVKVSNSNLPGYDFERLSTPIELSSSYWVVTNQWIANNGDGYLTDVTPLQVVPTKLGYTQELERFLINLSPEKWIPPTMDEMSTLSFNATGLPVRLVTEVEPEPKNP